MARYPVVTYLFSVLMPTGMIITRMFCPECGDLHYEIEHREEVRCFGCGVYLSVEGLELIASEIPTICPEEEEQRSGDDPDHPSFWYYSDN